MSKRELTSFEQMFLNSPTCLLWPDCACHQNLINWQEALQDEERTFDLEELAWAEELIFFTCACVAEHCPDPQTKAYGARQLTNLTQRRQRIALAQLRERSTALRARN
jgi:hypothetical protein